MEYNLGIGVLNFVDNNIFQRDFFEQYRKVKSSPVYNVSDHEAFITSGSRRS